MDRAHLGVMGRMCRLIASAGPATGNLVATCMGLQDLIQPHAHGHKVLICRTS